MSLFDSIINEAGQKFNLGDKTSGLLSSLLALITDKTHGGFAGFLEKFERAGLGGLTSSWINSGANTSISNEQLESALGNETLQSIANQTGTDYKTAASATAFMLPRVIDNLTPDGVLPDENDLLSKTGAAATIGDASAANTFDRIGTSATDVIDAGAKSGDRIRIADAPEIIEQRSNATIIKDADNYDDSVDSPMKWLLPLILLGLLIALGFWFCGKSSEPVKAPAVTNVNANKPANVNANTTSE